MTRRSGPILLAVVGLTFALGFYMLARGTSDPINLALYQTEPLVDLGDTASLCLVAHYRDDQIKLGKVAQLLRLTSDGIKASPRIDTSEVRSRCAPILQTLGLPLDAALVDVQWKAERTFRTEVPSTG